MHIKAFSNLYKDVTKEGTKIPKESYLSKGRYPVIDQGQQFISGRWDNADGIINEVPAIIFGDHTRCIKYIDEPFFIGADGVKVLRAVNSTDNLKYLYYALQAAKIPDLGYSRHFKVLKELNFCVYSKEKQDYIVRLLEKIDALIEQLGNIEDKYDLLIKSRFIELFGDPILNTKDWPLVPIDNICRSILGGGTPAKSHPDYYIGNIPWVTPKDMKTHFIDRTIDCINEQAVSNSSVNLIPPKSVLMVIRSGILKHTLPVSVNKISVTFNQDMKAFIPSDKITAEFLLYYFKAVEKDILVMVRSVTADNIDFKVLKERKIILPPVILQKNFSYFVNEVDKSKSVNELGGAA